MIEYMKYKIYKSFYLGYKIFFVCVHLFMCFFYSELFAINKNGIISLAGQKGLYTRDSYTLIIEAVDSGLPPRTANIVVTINLQLCKFLR